MKKITLYLATLILISLVLCSCAGTATSTTINISSSSENTSSVSQTSSEVSPTSSADSTSSYASSLQAFGDVSSEDISSLLAQASSEQESVASVPPKVVVKKVVTTTYSTVDTSSAQTSSDNTVSASQSVIKVMPIGEITTSGGVPDSSSSAYRQILADKYSSLNVKTEYVGTQNTASAEMKDANIYHCGYTNATAKSILENEINNIIQCDTPDIIILMLGRNDIIQGTDVNDFLNYLAQTVDKLKSAYPSAKIFLPSVPPVRQSDGAEQMSDSDIEKAYFEGIKLVASQKQVEFIDMSVSNSSLDSSCYTDAATSYAYPNKQGYEKIADVIFKATENTVNSLKK